MSRNNTYTKIRWMPLPRTEKAETLHNPYCGLYSIFRFFIDHDTMHPNKEVIEEVSIDPDQRICLVEINLNHFNEMPLSEASLLIARRIFQHFTAWGKQMIVRFVYDWEGKGVLNEPKDISIILNHMRQLSPLLKDYTKEIYVLQGLFIGSWGEMHSSRYLSDRNMTRLANQLYECAGSLTQIALRCPSFWRMLFRTYQPLDEATAFADIQKARFSLFNDGIMASEEDFGTYGNMNAINSKSYNDKWVREEELQFQNKLCRYVSNGGEAVNECRYNDPMQAIQTLRVMRVSYLHSEYDELVLNKWKDSRAGIPSVLWRDKTAFEYIDAHLGYRFTIEDVNLSILLDKSGRLKVLVKISNMGFSPCYHKFDVKLVVRTASFSEVYEYAVDTDTRMWMPDEKVELEVVISVVDWKHTNYVLCLGIYDPRSQRSIQIANTFSTEDHTGVYSLGNFIIK